MRDIKRIEPLLETLRKIWLEHPDYRLMQLLGNVYRGDPYYVEDDDLLQRLESTYLPERDACINAEIPVALEGEISISKVKDLVRKVSDLQAQLRQVEGQSQQQAEEAVIVFAKYTTLRQLMEVHTKQLTELTIIPIGCSREQELRWTQSIKDLRATLAAKDVHHHTEERHE